MSHNSPFIPLNSAATTQDLDEGVPGDDQRVLEGSERQPNRKFFVFCCVMCVRTCFVGSAGVCRAGSFGDLNLHRNAFSLRFGWITPAPVLC